MYGRLNDRRGPTGSRGDHPRLVLMDMQLPAVSGLEVLRQIRARRQLRTVPVVVLTAVGQDKLVADCLEAGANAFVTKSTHYQKLRRSISRIATFWNNEYRVPGCESRAVT
ncbi:MAG: response regulator [Candidatus Nealsonbacteria bacterium]|nr:response regulator [Candidatus Nealsonbacteria bacterium]